jgi:hypothetical protein
LRHTETMSAKSSHSGPAEPWRLSLSFFNATSLQTRIPSQNAQGLPV